MSEITLTPLQLRGAALSADDDSPQRIFTALIGCSVIVTGLILADPRFAHWFVIPVVICGALIGADAIAVLQGRIPFMDPVGILGVLGVHFFFVAPLLHVWWDEWMQYITPPPDWRDWLGGMALLNAVGLVVYRLSRDKWCSRRLTWTSSSWQLTANRTGLVFTALLILCALLQIWVYVRFGGISGYIDTYLDGERHYGQPSGFTGMGWLFTISESFPILAMFAFVHYLRSTGTRPRWPSLFAVLAIYFGLLMLFGGLRGSRSNTVWGLFWAVAIIHYWVRKVTPMVMAVGLTFFLLFMYVYGFYKEVGTDALGALGGSEHREELSQRTGRTLHGTILGDLGRSDVQAFALYKMVAPPADYQYAWGRTYLGAIALLIPGSVWPDRPPTKIRETTELETGRGSFSPGVLQSSRVYGLAGEAMLNFGPVAVPFTFLALGFVVSRVRQWLARLTPDDSRCLMAPLLVMFSFLVLVNDSDVNLFFMVKYGFVPFVAVLISSRRYKAAV